MPDQFIITFSHGDVSEREVEDALIDALRPDLLKGGLKVEAVHTDGFGNISRLPSEATG